MADTKPQRLPVIITTSLKNEPKYTDLLSHAFLTDPVFTYLLLNTPWYHKAAATYHIIRLQCEAAAYKSRGTYYSVTDNPSDPKPQCCAVIMHPGEDLLEMGPIGWGRLIAKGFHKMFWYAGVKPWVGFHEQYATPVTRAKSNVFAPDEKYYYVQYIATNEKHRGKGLAQSLLSDVQAKAQKEMKPVWLEASSPSSRKVYLKCGFVDVGLDGEGKEEMRLGVGEVNDLGEKAVAKEAIGVPVAPMVWFPEGYTRKGGKKE